MELEVACLWMFSLLIEYNDHLEAFVPDLVYSCNGIAVGANQNTHFFTLMEWGTLYLCRDTAEDWRDKQSTKYPPKRQRN
ncbi:MAG: hypothetical protein BWY76_01712 [bacterium ADurb.Bin429]|nr:MAG: hypothetical protein BWY76_01712 [bacterium ADurb.Bin429]